MKKYLKFVPFIAVAILVGVTAVYAGNLTPPTGDKTNTMHSLQDIIDLANGTPRTIDPTLETPGAVEESGITLNDVYDVVAGAVGGGGLLKTGATHCNESADDYESFSQVDCTGTNQDGDLQRGTARSYTDNGDGTVTDNVTKLTWQKCSAGQTGLDCSGDSAVTYTMDDGNGNSPAIDYCENLDLAGGGWHLPNVNELQSLADYGRISPSIDPAFPLTLTGNYWSSTAYESEPSGAWYVAFTEGYVGDGYVNGNDFVRCVRDGTPE